MTHPSGDRDFPLKRFLGMEVDSPAPGEATARVHIAEDHMNPFGAAHGAVVFAMIDTSMGRAATSVLEEDQRCASTDVHVRFLRPLGPGPVVARSEVIRHGRTLIQLESRVTDAHGRLVATGTGAFAMTGA